MKNNINILKDCYGCGVCTAVCPEKIIDIIENGKGFYVPAISDDEKCIECGLCLKVCSYNHKEPAPNGESPECFAGWSNDRIIRKRCSSGGVGFEIGKKLLDRGYRICGVRYNIENQRAEHFIANGIKDLSLTIGSKYIQSFTQDAFMSISHSEKYLVTGTPCQIDSFRRLIRHFNIEENFILLDFFCHGVPSLLLWREYLHEVEEKIGKIGYIEWRNKSHGWHNSYNMGFDHATEHSKGMQGDNVDEYPDCHHFYHSTRESGDWFYKFFLGNYCLNKCCYRSCKYKLLSSSADIRIGDMWGELYKDNDFGVNAVVAFTDKGKALMKDLKSCAFDSIEDNVVTDGQMRRSPAFPAIYNAVVKSFGSGTSLEKVYRTLILPYQILRIPIRAVNKLCKMLRIPPIFNK